MTAVSAAPSAIQAARVLVVDFGSQVSQLIARRVREIGVYCELVPWDLLGATPPEPCPRGIILSGGPRSANESDAPRAPDWVFSLGVPVLGICYGFQTMAVQLGGAIENVAGREYGYARLKLTGDCPWFSGLSDPRAQEGDEPEGARAGEEGLTVWMSHGDHVKTLPAGFTVAGSTESCELAAAFDAGRRFFGVQFHPEVTHTLCGTELLRRFVVDICGLETLWQPQAIIETAVEQIKAQVGPGGRVLLALSGGVDSSVTALLLQKALGSRLTCVFVDNGLLRAGEAQEVMARFGRLGLALECVDAAALFLEALRGVSDPEAKRKVIGRTFIEVFAKWAREHGNCEYLAQGTIYPDVIESARTRSGTAQVIKSHHNVGGLPPDLKFKLVEPLRELFKDEVRRVGAALGLDRELLTRHPFPGPGLGVRVLGEIREEYLKLLRAADAIFMEELRSSGWYERVSQAFTVFLPVRAVGVMGDQRSYGYVVSLRAVVTVDFMTARWAQLPQELLGKISNRIINEVPGITRVVYDISGKPPATIEWE